MKKRFDLDTDLVKGKNGVFEVEFDGDLVFSKKSLGRFPKSGEVEEIVANRLG